MPSLLAHLRGNVVAYLALFVALSGTAYAATALPKNSVGTKQIKKRAVTGAKVKGNTLTGKQIRESTLGQVPLAARSLSADTAANAANATNAVNAANAAKAADAATLGGQPPSAFLGAGAKAADSATLGGQPPSAFLGAGAKAADADRWDGVDSSVLGTRKTYAGSAFAPREDDQTNRIYVSTGAISCGGTSEDFQLDVDLPQGATITGLDYGFVDNSASTSVLSLYGFDALGEAPLLSTSIVTAFSNGDNGERRKASATPNQPHVVDNGTWAYVLAWSPGACGTNDHQLAGASVRYTLPTG